MPVHAAVLPKFKLSPPKSCRQIYTPEKVLRSAARIVFHTECLIMIRFWGNDFYICLVSLSFIDFTTLPTRWLLYFAFVELAVWCQELEKVVFENTVIFVNTQPLSNTQPLF